MGSEKLTPLGKRSRADSVLGNRMDEHLNYKRMKTSSEKWTKIQRVIEKPETQLCLIEVPKGVSFLILNRVFSSILRMDFKGLI